MGDVTASGDQCVTEPGADRDGGGPWRPAASSPVTGQGPRHWEVVAPGGRGTGEDLERERPQRSGNAKTPGHAR
ncbi:hypothetical protein KRH_00080 [Kocuria rhizophila DC2201]|uniref:Uncharacterized protein n=1 Tax=Kocuria rhizophila (strain ATCC 9341 / DSM 348 / NBRC 103217 / DC2201) TaxID=378753 RepID=B2GIG5_KOCRD|nr:hypothetical protein KRH_00080 [Kocuria rhizophila DC2201]